jgi:hypothetical protein
MRHLLKAKGSGGLDDAMMMQGRINPATPRMPSLLARWSVLGFNMLYSLGTK